MKRRPWGAIEANVSHGRRQREVILDFLRSYQAEHGWMPTVREVASALGTNASTAHSHLRTLHDDGRIVLGGGPRMIRLESGDIRLRHTERGGIPGVDPRVVDE